jgi:hypothetical protein
LPESAASEEERAGEGEAEMQQDRNLDGDGRGEECERPVERVQHPGLRVGEEGRAHEQIRVPKREVSGEQDAGAVVPIRIEVEKGVAAREDEVREGEFPEEQEAEENPKPHGPNPKGGTKATHAGMRRS